LCICARILIEFPSRTSGSGGKLAHVHQTLTELRDQCGSAYRIQIDAEPNRRKRPVTITVRWQCGCSAGGAHLTALAAVRCPAHATTAHRPRARRRAIPLLGTLLTRP
jgi:hypothetical protein